MLSSTLFSTDSTNKITALSLSTLQIAAGLFTTANAASVPKALTGAALSGAGLFAALDVLKKDPKNVNARDYLIECLSGSVYQLISSISTHLTKEMNVLSKVSLNMAANILATVLSELVKSPFTGKLENLDRETIAEAAIAGGARSFASHTMSNQSQSLLLKGSNNAMRNTTLSGAAYAIGGAAAGIFTKFTMYFWTGKEEHKSKAVSQGCMDGLNASAAGGIVGYRAAVFGS
jgi:hypothetical protein